MTGRSYPISIFLDTLLEIMVLPVIIDDLKTHKVSEFNNKKRAIYKNLIINICASFEVFLEETLVQSIDFISEKAESSKEIPANIKVRIAENLINKSDNRQIWEISDDGWRNHLKINLEALKNKFHTPRPDKIDDYFYKSIGIKSISKNWKWSGFSAKNSEDYLNNFMTLRGNIVHRYKPNKQIHKIDILRHINFLHRICCITANTVDDKVFEITKKRIWSNHEIRNLL